MKKLIVANWKMNGDLSSNRHLVNTIDNNFKSLYKVVICPPSIYLSQVRDLLSENSALLLGAQNVYSQNQGSVTGELSTQMLLDFQVKYVIVGHSERRTLIQEDTACITNKVKAALSCGITPILCCGENLEQLNANQTAKTLEQQLDNVLNSLDEHELKNLIIAYEPVWAIGSGKVATCEDILKAKKHIDAILDNKARKLEMGSLNIPFLYGGSVSPDNSKQLLESGFIDGLLVGKASLDATSMLKIINN